MSEVTNNMMKICDRWADIVYDEWKINISIDQQPWLMNKILYAARKAAGRRFIAYCEGGINKDSALAQALAYRKFSDYFGDDKTTDDAKIAKSISASILGIGDEVAEIEKPEDCSDEEWAEVQYEALHDSEGYLIAPKLEGFLTGAYYEMPCLYPSEFDEENARRMVTACMQSVLLQCNKSRRNCLKWLSRANTTKFKAQWQSNYKEAKTNIDATEAFIKLHDLYYEQ